MRSSSVLQQVVVLGEGGVGKSAIIMQFVQNQFVLGYDPTIEDSFRRQITIDHQEVIVDITDTAGQEAYCVLRDQYIKVGGGFILVYSVTNRTTFAVIDDFYENILRVQDKTKVPLVLVGNKSDLVEQREVSTEEGKSMAAKLGCPFIEASAKLRLHVDDIFITLLRIMMKQTSSISPEIRALQLSPRAGRSLSAADDGGSAQRKRKGGSYVEEMVKSGEASPRPKSTQVEYGNSKRKKRSFCTIS